jgi:NAD(P)-dependent dehydrogenase (short-subunit alcohol dehydrogenase family)
MSDAILENPNIMDRFRLDGRVALITGAAQGIGRGFAHALGEAGANVAIVDLDLAAAEVVSEELTKKNIDAMAIKADVTDQDDIEAMVKRVTDRWGTLTIAVNNAGVGMWADAANMERSDWGKIIDLDLNAVFYSAQAEAQAMIPEGYGKIINTASMSAHIVNTPQHQSAYNTAKAGVLHLTRSLAAEWAPKGIRVNSISPGYTRTKLVDDLLSTPEGKSVEPEWLSLTPIGRLGEVSDLQGAVVYLAAGVSDFMTGHDMLIDGGYCCW